MSHPRAIIVLVDGVPASQFAAWRPRLHALDAMAREGMHVARLSPHLPTVSRPGRSVLLTGRTGESNGVYGNNVLDGASFRAARAGDIRGLTLPAAALQAGRVVAGVGFGMLDPASTSVMLEPWWMHAKTPGNTNLKIPRPPAPAHDPHGLLAGWSNAPFSASPGRHLNGMFHPQMHGLAADHAMVELAGNLACGDNPPDLILTEIAVTDTIMHYHGHDSEAGFWVTAMADLILGRLADRLRAAGRWEDTLLAIVSDHGMGTITTALYPETLLPDAVWATEGGTIQVKLDSAPADLEARLAGYGITRLSDDHLPPDVRGLVAQFSAPFGTAFETLPEDGVADGRPTTISTHGNTPGTAEDDGILILTGGAAPRGFVEQAPQSRFAPTVAGVLGLALGEGAGRSLVS